MNLFHATSARNLLSIAREGLRSGAYFTSCDDLLAYYEETVEDEGATPAILQVSLLGLAEAALLPDMPGIEEPITTVIGMSEDDVQDLWNSSGQTWRDSLEIVRSLRYASQISPEMILVVTEDGTEPLLGYLGPALHRQDAKASLSP